MRILLRRIRGIVGMGFTWSVFWAIFGGIVGAIQAYLSGTPFGTSTAPLAAFAILQAVTFGTWGFLTGSAFSIVLSIAERRKVLNSLKLLRVGAWGAIAGGLLPFVTALARWRGDPFHALMSGATVLLGAGLGASSAMASLTMARAAPGQPGEGRDVDDDDTPAWLPRERIDPTTGWSIQDEKQPASRASR